MQSVITAVIGLFIMISLYKPVICYIFLHFSRSVYYSLCNTLSFATQLLLIVAAEVLIKHKLWRKKMTHFLLGNIHCTVYTVFVGWSQKTHAAEALGQNTNGSSSNNNNKTQTNHTDPDHPLLCSTMSTHSAQGCQYKPRTKLFKPLLSALPVTTQYAV